MVFRPEFLFPAQTCLRASLLEVAAGFDAVSEHLALEGRAFRVIKDTIAQMREDATIEAPPDRIHSLLRHQLYALVLRLAVQCAWRGVDRNSTSASVMRFRKFKRLLEENFAKWHRVADYAGALRCSEKSLTRAALDSSGSKAKTVIASRINLEAKRLLAQTHFTISVIGERLGFEDATTFVKFFKRETGKTPGEFRRQQNDEKGTDPGQAF